MVFLYFFTCTFLVAEVTITFSLSGEMSKCVPAATMVLNKCDEGYKFGLLSKIVITYKKTNTATNAVMPSQHQSTPAPYLVLVHDLHGFYMGVNQSTSLYKWSNSSTIVVS